MSIYYLIIIQYLILTNIINMYNVARTNPDLNFKIAFRNTHSISLNGYTGFEMINMFLKAGEENGIPENIWFSEEWKNTGAFEN